MEQSGAQTLADQLVEARRRQAVIAGRLMELAVRFEEADGHMGHFPDVVSWLAWNLGATRRTARRWLRVGRALHDLPLVARAFAGGVLSIEQVHLLIRVATPENEYDLIELAREAGDADSLREEVQALERLEKEQAELAPAEPADLPPETNAHMQWDGDVLNVEAQIVGADGVMFEKAVLRMAEQAPKEPESGLYRDFELRAGDALAQMASESLANDGDHDRATVVVQVSAEALVARSGPGWEAATRMFSEEDLDRMLCDSRIQPALVDSSGVTVGVGRTTRTIPPWLRRLVETRDQHCRFPGCRRSRWLHIHHRIPWSEGGPTNLDNLVALCGFHHRLLHRTGLEIRGGPGEDLRFHYRNGRRIRPAADRWPAGWETMRLDHFEHQARTRLAALTGAPS